MAHTADCQKESKGPDSENRLHGWDDEKIYFWSPEAGELCVSDEPELIRRLTEACQEYYQNRGLLKPDR